MAVPPVTPLPTPPNRQTAAAEFTERADAFLGALPQFQLETSAVAAYAEQMAGEADVARQSAEDARDQAGVYADDARDEADAIRDIMAATMHFKGRWSDLSGALAVPASVEHLGAVWLLLENLPEVSASEPGATDDWLRLGVTGMHTAYGELKSSIVLMDFNPGTRSWTVPPGVRRIRAFVVGAGGSAGGSGGSGGGGYSEKVVDVTAGQSFSYTVGASATDSDGGTSSFGGLISATGGKKSVDSNGAAGGVGTGGDINTNGGSGSSYTGSGASGGGAGHAFGNGQAGASNAGGGFSAGPVSFVDGWKIGLLPGGSTAGGYGVGSYLSENPGLGGGGLRNGGLGGGGSGGGSTRAGGSGLVGIEVIA